MDAWDEYVAEVGQDEAQEQTLLVWAAVKRASKELAPLVVDEHKLFDTFCEHCIDKFVEQRKADRFPKPVTVTLGGG